MSILQSKTKELTQLLEDPELITTIQEMPSEALAALIDRIGLEDTGEILALATTEQLLNVIDMDVWQNAHHGEDETFDPERFLLWLEILLEAGEAALVKRLTSLPDDLVVMAFYAHLLVLNLDELAAEMSDRNEPLDLTEKALSNCLCHEMSEYLIIARRGDGWDTLLTAILALDEQAPDLLSHILAMCCYASSEHIMDNGGLYQVLTAEEMLYADAAADRADRRARVGYVSPSDATAFLKLAVSSSLTDASDETPDPISLAYFREWKGAPITTGNAIPKKDALLYLANILSAAFGTTEAPVRPADAVQAVSRIYQQGLNALPPRRLAGGPAHDTHSGAFVIHTFMVGFQGLFSSRPPSSIRDIFRALEARDRPPAD